MRPLAFALTAACALSAGAARADRVVLAGGTVVEGKAARRGDQVVIQIESGEITLPRDAVVRIEKRESALDRYAALRAALRPGDLKGLLSLADHCRDHGLRAEEQRTLRDVLELDRDHEQARLRLGYVKTEAGWVTRADAFRARGMVQRDGRWVTRSESMEIDRLHLEEETALLRRDQAETEIETKRVAAANERAAEEARRERAATMFSPTQSYGHLAPYYRAGFAYPDECRSPGGCRRSPGHAFAQPYDTSLSVVKVPYRHP